MMSTDSTIFTAFLNGFTLMITLIVAIGAQNAFVLRQGLKREYVFLTSAICTFGDVLLVTVGVLGFGALIAQNPGWIVWASWGGALFLFAYGARAFWNARKPGKLQVKEGAGTARTLRYVASMTMAFTFLNPHVYLDTVVLMGSVAAQYSAEARPYYIAGSYIASTAWFFGLGFGARFLVPLFKSERSWQILDILIGIIMWLTAASLVF